MSTSNHLPISSDAFDDFWQHVEVGNGCWNWQAGLQYGYGQWRGYRAHRVAFSQVFGEIPEGLVIDHMCRNKACVNPYHLDAVTSRQNSLRSPVTCASINNQKTHCQLGHEYTPKNTRLYRGKRHCRKCEVIRDRRRYREKPARRERYKRALLRRANVDLLG